MKIVPIITENDGAIVISTTWSSSNEEIATVEDGVIRGHSNGTAIISLTVTDILDNVYEASCEVVVDGFTTQVGTMSNINNPNKEVYDVTGKIISNDLNSLPSGIYIVKDGNSSHKIYKK